LDTRLRTGSSGPPRGVVASRGGLGSSRKPGSRAKRRGDVGNGVSWLWTWLHGSQVKLRVLLNGATAFVLMLAIAGLYFLNYRPYHAAQLFPVQSTSLHLFVTDARRSFDTFPPLATLPRQVLLDTLSKHWDRANDDTRLLLLQTVQAEGQAAIESEPQNARLYLGLARLYQRAGTSDPAYVSAARRYVERAKELAPLISETILVSVNQDIAERNYAEALSTIFSYVGERLGPGRGQFWEPMHQAKDGLIGQIGGEEYRCRWEGKADLTLEERAKIECEESPTS